MTTDKTSKFFTKFGAVGKAGFQLRQTVVNQVKPNVRFRRLMQVGFNGSSCYFSLSLVLSLSCIFSKFHGCTSNFQFTCARALADSLNDVAVAITRRKFHLRVSAGRIRSQQRLDETDALGEVAPIEGPQKAHAGNEVADRDPRRRLTMVVSLNDLLASCC